MSCQARPQWGHNFGKKYWSAAASESKRGLVFPLLYQWFCIALLSYVDVPEIVPEWLIRWGRVCHLTNHYYFFFRQYYNDNVKSLDQERDFAANKTKAVAWFVSNCGARNGRLNYAKELGKYIQVSRQNLAHRANWCKSETLSFYHFER